jgi:hypothetical protein
VGFGLHFAGSANMRQQGHMDIQHVVAPDILAHLPNGLQKRQPFDIADSSADLDDHHIRPGLTGNGGDP